MNPSNLMIDSNYSIKLADFGLAQRFSQSMNMMNSIVVKILGTLAFMKFKTRQMIQLVWQLSF